MIDHVSKFGDLTSVTSMLRSLGNIKPILVLGQGAVAGDPEAEKDVVLQAGANIFLSRPYSLEMLKETLVQISLHDTSLKPMSRPASRQSHPIGAVLVQDVVVKDLVIGIVCDDRIMRKVLSTALRKTGARCQPLSSEFSEAVIHSDCDLIVLDSTCKLKDSEIKNILAEANLTLRVPVLVITSAHGKGLEKWIEAGATALLPRPFHHITLCRAVKEAVAENQRSKNAEKEDVRGETEVLNEVEEEESSSSLGSHSVTLTTRAQSPNPN